MIDLIHFSSSPHVPTKDYSHIMVGDEVMAMEIIVESMAMMTAFWFAKSYMPLGLGFFSRT
jgi:hypothetical protein